MSLTSPPILALPTQNAGFLINEKYVLREPPLYHDHPIIPNIGGGRVPLNREAQMQLSTKSNQVKVPSLIDIGILNSF